MLRFILLILLSTLVAAVLAPFLIGFLYRYNIRRPAKQELDSKIKRNIKKLGTPVMGGLLIITTTYGLNVFFNRAPEIKLLLAVLLVGAVLGAIDDLFNVFGHDQVSAAVRSGITPIVTVSKLTWNLYQLLLLPWNMFKESFRAMGSYRGGFRAHEKFLLQCLLAGLASWWLYVRLGFHSVWMPLLGRFDLGAAYPFLSALLMITYANAFSITDGLDGLSAGLHSLSFLSLGVAALALGQTRLGWFCAVVVGAELAFLYFNIYPARVEMSDVGTLPLGMVFVLVGLLLNRELLLPIVGGVFTVEILSSFIQVWSVKLRGRRVFRIAPIHHHFEALGWPETKVTMRFWWAGVLLSLLGLFLMLL